MDNEQEPQHFTQVPNFIKGLGLNPTEKLVYGIIYTMLNVNRRCFMGNGKIAEAVECNKSTVSHAITKLVRLGLLKREIEYKDGSKEINRRYLVLGIANTAIPMGKSCNTLSQNITMGMGKSCKENRLLNKSLNRLPNNNMSSSDEHDDHSAAKEIISYLNKKAGKHFRNTASNYRLIEPRLKEYSVNDLKQVIDNKCSEWLNTDMDKYLRIETLFRASKIDGYLNEKPKKGHDVDGLDF